MSRLLSGLIFFGILFSSDASFAFLGFSDTKLTTSYPCLGLDGVPITDATLSASCCSGSHLNANAPENCRTSLYGAGVQEATAGTGSGFAAAQSALDAANDLNGASTDYSGTTSTPTSGLTAVSAASTNGGDGSLANGTSTTGTSGVSSAGTGAGAGVGGADSGSGIGGGGSGGANALGTAGGTGANVTGTPADAGVGSDGGAYAKSGDGSSGANGKGKVGGLFGSLFGNQGGAGGTGDAKDANFGNGSGDGNGDGSGKDQDAMTGTTVDPADYFSRIDKSASIFKVVSNRYMKETERKHLGIAKITQ